jgi:tight adherence protein C
MSDLFLLLSLVGTFGAITAVGFAVEVSRSRRRRAVEILESQIDPIPVANVREHELARPVTERAVVPILTAVGRVGRRITPLDVRDRLARKLVLAGSPEAWDADRIAAFKVVGLVVGAAGGVALSRYLGLAGLQYFILIALATAGGYLLPDVFLNRAAEERQTAIRRALPDTMDLLTISVEAGLGFDAALAQVREHVPGPLSEEIARMLQEVQLGVSRQDAFRHMSERSDVEELQGFVLAMVQADVFGISVSRVLRAQAKELRTRRRQRAERTAMQIPVKILFPMIFCVMPALFVVVIGPGALTIIENFSGAF